MERFKGDTPTITENAVPCKVTETGERFYFTPGNGRSSKTLATIFKELQTNLGPFKAPSSGIPIEVASSGKAPIMAYLAVVHEKSDEEIAEVMSVSKSTVQQYLSHIKAGRRMR